MAYGGMPYDELLKKMEETDPELQARVLGEGYRPAEEDYEDYVRAEIVDRAPEATYLESDHARREATLPRTVLNLRHSGGRGPNDHRMSTHPELFVGFTGNDPRGVVNQPRMGAVKAHTAARMKGQEPRMGKSAAWGEEIEIERPWGGSFEYDKISMKNWLKGNFHWFLTEKVTKAPWGRNEKSDYQTSRWRKHLEEGTDDEAFQGQPGGSSRRPHRHTASRDTEGSRPKRSDGPAGRDTAPWRNTSGDVDLAVAKYTGSTRAGRETYGTGGTGGALLAQSVAGSEFGAHARALAANRQTLALALAAASRQARNRQTGGDTAHGASADAFRAGVSAAAAALSADFTRAALVSGSRPGQDGGRPAGQIQDHEGGTLVGLGALPADSARAQWGARSGQDTRPAGQVQDHEGGVLVGQGALPSDPAALAWSGVQGHATAPSVSNVGATVARLKGGSAADLRQALGKTLAGAAKGSATEGVGLAPADRGLAPTSDVGSALRASLAHISRASAAEGLEVYPYGRRERSTHDAVQSAFAGGFATARESRGGRREGRSKGPEFRAHTQTPTSLGSEAHRTFGSVGERAGAYTGALALGEKNLRSTVLSDRGDDVLSGRGLDGASGPMGGDLFSASSVGAGAN